MLSTVGRSGEGERKRAGAMKRRRVLRRWLTVVLISIPLLQSGTCVDLTTRSLINGFFDAVTPELDARLAADLSQQSP